MALYTANKPIYRNNVSRMPLNHPQNHIDIHHIQPKYVHHVSFTNSQKLKQKLNKQQIMMLEMIDEKGMISMFDKGEENMIEAKKEALMEMIKYRYKKVIQLQNKRLVDRRQFQNDLQKIKRQIKNKAIVQANRVKAESRERVSSVRNWMKKNSQEGSRGRQQKWLNQAIKHERDTDQLEMRKQLIQNRHKSMLISRPKRVNELNKTSYYQSAHSSHPVSTRVTPRSSHFSKKEMANQELLLYMNKREDEFQQSLKSKGLSLGLYQFYSKPVNSILLQ